jgi:hypothetical protein
MVWWRLYNLRWGVLCLCTDVMSFYALFSILITSSDNTRTDCLRLICRTKMMLEQLNSDMCKWQLQIFNAQATYKSVCAIREHYLDNNAVILHVLSSIHVCVHDFTLVQQKVMFSKNSRVHVHRNFNRVSGPILGKMFSWFWHKSMLLKKNLNPDLNCSIMHMNGLG